MNSLIWLAMEMAILLLAAALVFFYLGWRWRGTPVVAEMGQELTEPEAETTSIEEVPPVLAKATLSEPELVPAAVSEDAGRLREELDDAEGHRRNLEREVMRLRDDLKFTRLELNRLRELSAQTEPIPPAAAAPSPMAEPMNLWTKPAPAPAHEPVAKPEAKPLVVVSAVDLPPQAAERLQALAVDMGRVRMEQEGLKKQRADMVVEQEIATDKHDAARRGAAAMKLREAEQRLAGLDKELQALESQDAALRRTVQMLQESGGVDDDLTKIKGVKAVLNKKLHAFGVRTYRQIIAWSEADVAAFSELLAFKNRIKRDKWQEQAQKLECDKDPSQK